MTFPSALLFFHEVTYPHLLANTRGGYMSWPSHRLAHCSGAGRTLRWVFPCLYSQTWSAGAPGGCLGGGGIRGRREAVAGAARATEAGPLPRLLGPGWKPIWAETNRFILCSSPFSSHVRLWNLDVGILSESGICLERHRPGPTQTHTCCAHSLHNKVEG